MAVDGLIAQPSAFGAKATLDRLASEVERHGMTVFARVDHAAGAKTAGLELRPTELLIFGGKLSIYVELAETARQEAYEHMCEHAAKAGANAVIGTRYDANEIMDGITEVLAYGTAVRVEPA